MARYVMLEFDDNEEAKAFVKAAQEGLLYYTKQHPTLPNEVSVNQVREGVRPRGMWFKPVNYCECQPQPEDSARNFVRGSKFGIYVHKVCMRPFKGRQQSPKNLIDPVWERGESGRMVLSAKEPIETADPIVTGGGTVVIPNLGLHVKEPTPKAEADRVARNVSSLS